MPLIQELPVSKSAVTPGWAYVADTGFDPSKAAIVPSGSRKRSARTSHIPATGELSTRQQSKIQQHLASLDKENHRDVQIPLPSKSRDNASKGLHGNMTPGVRKVLLSQKTFANHLADEEAAIANQEAEEHSSRRIAKGGPAKAKRASTSHLDVQVDAMDTDDETPIGPEAIIQDETPLLKVTVPSAPTKAEIDDLLAAPPLSYNAARAPATASTAPARHFCEICGYWGRARCMKCGARVCGLECKNQHEETSCQKFWM